MIDPGDGTAHDAADEAHYPLGDWSPAPPPGSATADGEDATPDERASLRARMEAAFEGFDGNLLAANTARRHDSPA